MTLSPLCFHVSCVGISCAPSTGPARGLASVCASLLAIYTCCCRATSGPLSAGGVRGPVLGTCVWEHHEPHRGHRAEGRGRTAHVSRLCPRRHLLSLTLRHVLRPLDAGCSSHPFPRECGLLTDTCRLCGPGTHEPLVFLGVLQSPRLHPELDFPLAVRPPRRQ